MRKGIFIFALLFILFAVPALAASDIETPPVSTITVTEPELVSFRVWVLEGIVDGVQVSGHYEYFDMYMDTGKQHKILEPVEQEPAMKAVPVTQGTAPATM